MLQFRFALAALLCALPLSAPLAEDDHAHRVEPGDTLIGLRDRLLVPGADWRVLQKRNRIADPLRLVPGSTLLIPRALLREVPVVAEVIHAHGDVTLQRGSAEPQPLVGGDRVAAGDLLRTGPQSSATLRFADGARVLVRPGSTLRVERSVRLGDSPSVDTRLRLEQGSADTQVPRTRTPRFEMRTPMANLGVRGTEFRTRVEDTGTAVEVLEGRVAAAPQAAGADARIVAAGFGALANASATSAPTELPPVPGLAGVPTRIERLPLRVPWTAAGGATRFRAQVFDAARPDRLVLDGLFDAAGARWPDDLPDGDYRLHVRAVGRDGLEGRDAVVPFTLKARPEPPFTTRPRAGGRTPDAAIEFAWTASSSAARYRLQVADSADFAAPRVDGRDLPATAATLELPLGTHHWRVASVRADGDQGPWGDAQTVTRVALPPAPSSEPPEATADGVLLRWRAAPDVRYQIQVARDATFTAPIIDETTTEARFPLRGQSGGTLHVRVRSVDADGFAGPWGAAQEVQLPRSLEWLWLLVPLLFGL